MIIFPDGIQKKLHHREFETDSIGLSESSVLIFPDQVLKIREDTSEARREAAVMRWLRGKISVPEVIAEEREAGKHYLLMSRVPGKMSCDPELMNDPDALTDALAHALQSLWQVDISSCPFDQRLENELAQAQFRVEHELVDITQTEPETFGPGGFSSPAELLQWLSDHRPKEEAVLSHGDFCMPNIFLSKGACFYIDLGGCGVADPWRDIALCYRSLKYNFAGVYGGKIHPDYDPDLLFEKLGILPDREKLRYYLLLDELF